MEELIRLIRTTWISVKLIVAKSPETTMDICKLRGVQLSGTSWIFVKLIVSKCPETSMDI